MNSEQRQLIKKYLDIIIRHKTIIILFFLLGTALGLGQYLRMPKVYQCTALLKYQRQSVNPTAMSPDDLRTRTRDVVDTVSEQIMSRTSLEAIVKEFNLYPGMQRSMPMEDIVDIMRKDHITTNLMRNGDVFEVSYQGSDQNKVMKVTNALAAKFIEENLRFRQEQASQTTIYVKDELKMAKEGLDDKERIMRDYKLQYYNEMPEQLVNNTNRLNALQEQYQNNQASSLELERTRLLVQEQIAQRKNFLTQLSVGTVPDTAAMPQGDNNLNTIQQTRLRLKQLQSRYTDKHPEIKRLNKILQDLESQQPQNLGDTTADTAALDVTATDPQILELKQQSKDLEFNINRLKDEREKLGKQIQTYENWIAAAPIREAEWSALTRDYDQLNEHYQGLVTQSLQAQSAQSLENQMKGSQFKIVDSAHFPETPFKPDFRKIMLMFIGVGVAIGGALALAIELLGTSFKDPKEVEEYLEIPVICAIPNLPTKKELLRKRLRKFAVNSMLLLGTFAVVGALAFFWKQGMIII